jgi:hypothetical protein
LQLVRIYHGAKAGWGLAAVADALASMPSSDLTAAAYEFFGRKYSELDRTVHDPNIAAFLRAYRYGDQQQAPELDSTVLIRLVVHMHTAKDAAYGDSWKKRGELVSILANVARKVDRLEQYRRRSIRLADESVLDTAIDLFVYLVKYRLYLFDLSPEIADSALAEASPPFSDQTACFSLLAETYASEEIAPAEFDLLVSEISSGFDSVYATVSSGAAVAERANKVADLGRLAFALVRRLSVENPMSLRSLRQLF